ncbi:MAG: fatty acid desaturase family protein [Myxococcota bacterium]
MDRTHWKQAFTPEEIRDLRKVSDLAGVRMIATDWGLILLSLAVVAAWPNPLTVAGAVVVIGVRQLGLAVLMHEASHRTLFRSRWLNDAAGNWLAAYWVFLSVELYRPYHLQHHVHTGTDKDPDLHLRTGYPTTTASMTRKVLRDLLGVVGVKRLVGTARFLLTAARGTGEASADHVEFLGGANDPQAARRALRGFAVTQLAFLGALWAVGQPWLYGVWALAWLTTQNLVTRLRSIAEHAMTDLGEDPFRNTRTVRTRGWERLFIAPHDVAFHLEHHLLMTVPASNLERFHAMLKARGLLEAAQVEDGYPALLRRAGRAEATS